MRPRPTISVCVITQDQEKLLPGLLANVARVADEIVVVDGGSRDRTPEIAAREPKVKLVHRSFDDHATQKNHAIDQAGCDWVLIVDTDERLGERLIDRIPVLVTHPRRRWYKFPRYWVVEERPYRYVRSPDHYPDWQLRLFRNEPFFRYEAKKRVHHRFPRQGRGAGKKVRGSHIFHLDFLLNDRAAREAKVARYTAIAPESASVHAMYLYEDQPHQIRDCRERITGPFF